jgi:hypothetical protein
MRVLLRIALIAVVLLGAGGAFLGTYLVGYRQGLRTNAMEVETPAPTIGARRHAVELGNVTMSKRSAPDR